MPKENRGPRPSLQPGQANELLAAILGELKTLNATLTASKAIKAEAKPADGATKKD